MITLNQQTISPSAAAATGKVAAASRIRMLLIDDDDEFRESLSLNLADEGFAVTTYADGPSVLEFASSGESVDVILLDWRMPGMNGLEVLRELRRRGVVTPVIFLTVLSDDIYEEAALAGGAVDFIDKSRRLSILVRRIELIAEGQRPLPDPSQQHPSTQLRLGQLELRFDINRAFWRGSAIDLTLTEFRMLSQLALKAGEDVSYRELYDLVHGKDFLSGSGAEGYRVNVRTFMKRIRKKLRNIDPSFEEIHNYAGFGYRWIVA
jgi:two-component system response regulator ChvI